MCLKYQVLVALNINTAVFCDVTPCSLAEETACLHIPEYRSFNCVILFQEVVHWRGFSLAKFMLCSKNNSNYSANWLNYLLRIILLSVCNSKKPKYLAQYINPLNPELNPICYLLALLGAYHFLHVSRIRVK